METRERDGAPVRFPPPLVYLLAVVAGGLLHEFVLSIRIGLAPGVRIIVAIALIGLGVATVAGAMGRFRRTGQNPTPWTSTPEIVSTGVYGITRNPMYVGMALLQAGIGIAWANGWIVALLAPVLVLIYAIAIRHEEAYLERKFGETYIAYKRSVRRWL
jgi:protein-S-isoprenylcysteine O-methyltransferase Ste14